MTIQIKNIYLWIVCTTIFTFVTSGFGIIHFYKSVTPLIISLFVVFLTTFTSNKFNKVFSYFLFFTVSITSMFGLTEALTGFNSESSNPLLFGVSFYSASLGYLLYKNSLLMSNDAFKVSNPLLLFSGPLALFIRSHSHMPLLKRIKYYFPFILVGTFFYQIIGVPLTESFGLIEKTDLVSTILFAIIFELFVYANFCGLSLGIYGLFGILGYKIPLNFKQPFSSNNIIEFWRGWHLSLSKVLKTLFYLPIRKNYSSGIALLFVYLASAMWHGVTFNFLIWGLFHAFMFFLTIKLLKRRINYLPTFILFFTIIFGRLIFAESDTSILLEKLSFNYVDLSAFNFIFSLPNTSKTSLILIILLVLIEFLFRKNKYVRKRNYKFLRTPIMLFFITLVLIFLARDIGVDFAIYGQR